MSIIPDPGPRPTVTPLKETISVSASTYTIAANKVIYANSLSAVLDGYNMTVTNHGTVWVDNDLPHAWFAGNGKTSVVNTGMIYVRGLSQVELTPVSLMNLQNSGSIYITSEEGWARGLHNSKDFMNVDNSGLLAVQSLGLGGDSYYWNATAVDAANLNLVNRAGGRILAEAPGTAIAVSAHAAQSLGKPVVDNAGLIEANSTAGVSIGVYIWQPGYEAQTIVNSGTIRGDYAIFATYSQESVTNPQEIVQNLSGGLLEGHVFLDTGDDVMTNDGTVKGDVDMGRGNDRFTGNGSVTGFVAMGDGDDVYIGSGGKDRVAGGRDNDDLSGRGGNDIVFGGFGNDVIRGDAGNDGLYGEWGDDTIHTQGGDFVEGNSGNDRIVLGDYSFEKVNGGAGVDTLVMAGGARNFDLWKMVSTGRVTDFEILSLAADQKIVINQASVSSFTNGAASMRVTGAASNTVFLDGGWTKQADVSVDGTSYQRWTKGSTEVVVGLDVAVQAASGQAYNGLDAIATTGGAAPRPGATSGLDYTDPAIFLRNEVLHDGAYEVSADEVFYSDGSPVFVSSVNSTLTNHGGIYALGDQFPSSRGVDFDGPGTVINLGLVYVEQIADPGRVYDPDYGPVFYYVSTGVKLGGANFDNPLENYGEIVTYSRPGSAMAVHNSAAIINTGGIYAISEFSRAIGVNAVYGSHISNGTQTFFNTGLIYAEAGGYGSQIYVEGDRFVPESIAATGVQSWGTLTNDGEIVATSGPNAAKGLLTVGVYAMDHYGNTARPAQVVNNGTIEGSRAIMFADNGTSNLAHKVINNGLLIGDVHFLNGRDIYDGSQGEIRGTVFGFGGNDTMIGGKFADSFDGGTGVDTMTGGLGDDTYYVDNVGDVVNEAVGEGTDTVIASASYTLAAGSEIEVLTLVGSGNLNAAGNAGSNRISGNSGNNILTGGLGNDWLDGAGGTDTAVFSGNKGQYTVTMLSMGVFEVRGPDGTDILHNIEFLQFADQKIALPAATRQDGTAGADTLTGTSGVDWLFGLGGNDVLYGHAGNDLLDGGPGADTMHGGLGDDVFYVDMGGDLVIELPGEGFDTVYSAFDVDLTNGGGYAHVEAYVLTGTATRLVGIANGTGNDLANVITANAQAPALLNGMGGDDTIRGGGNADTIYGGTGNDTIYGLAGNDVLHGDDGNDKILGGGNADEIHGGEGSDDLQGGNGADRIVGGNGNDFLKGNLGNDTLDGGAGNDDVRGNDGKDVLSGGAGVDLLSGGTGADRFVFDEIDFSGTGRTGSSVDRIFDFNRGEGDKIDLSAIDAIVGGDDNAFAFIGKNAFSGSAGQLRYEFVNGYTMVFMDVDGDANADFAFRVDGTLNLLAGDFVL